MRLINKIKRILIDSFSFSSTEANGFLVLMLIIFVIAIVPRLYLSFHRPQMDHNTLDEWAQQMEASIAEIEEQTQEISAPSRFFFDPNTAELDQMVALDIPTFLAQRIVNYRENGGIFRKKEDLGRIYGLSEELYQELAPWIRISYQEPEVVYFTTEEETYTPTDEISYPEVYFDLNAATAEELKRIRGVGEVLSSRIVRYRELLGGFQDYTQLNEVYGLNPEVIESIVEHSRLDSGHIRISINSVDSLSQLYQHPYIDYNLARAIVNYSRVHGDFQHLEELKELKILDDSLYHKIVPYLSL